MRIRVRIHMQRYPLNHPPIFFRKFSSIATSGLGRKRRRKSRVVVETKTNIKTKTNEQKTYLKKRKDEKKIKA